MILWPHILAMFLAMLTSTRAGLEFFSEEPRLKNLSYLSLTLFCIGGIVLGPIVQKYAFNAYWTGWPIGSDLTDNKTAVAFLAWVAAVVALYKSRRPKYWVLAAAIILLCVYLIPHSAFGSELDYTKAGETPISVPR